jgi:hypothetical protein
MSRCPLTGRLVPVNQFPDSLTFYYETPETGKVVFTDIALMEAPNLASEEKDILAGICRNRTINHDEPIIITAAFLKELKQQNIPYAFDARAKHFLKYLYDNGGKEYKSFDIEGQRDRYIAYASLDEFGRIMKYLKMENWIDPGQQFIGGAGQFHGLTLTRYGIQEIEKGQPKMPMFGLVNQKISTGDSTIDATIEHAREQFFGDPTSYDSKRSACEALSHVLEPLRDELKDKFDSDTEAFFNIVNNFTIRHNKFTTKKINNEEQLEWIFYSLLNTINTYYKMKRKTI